MATRWLGNGSLLSIGPGTASFLSQIGSPWQVDSSPSISACLAVAATKLYGSVFTSGQQRYWGGLSVASTYNSSNQASTIELDASAGDVTVVGNLVGMGVGILELLGNGAYKVDGGMNQSAPAPAPRPAPPAPGSVSYERGRRASEATVGQRPQAGNARVIVVGGGGGGGTGGGGGGGVVLADVALTAGTAYTAVVGAGGSGGTGAGGNGNLRGGGPGESSSFGTFKAIGGGGGGACNCTGVTEDGPGGSGGSSGGAGADFYNGTTGAATKGQGNRGADGPNGSYPPGYMAAGGGGGAGGVGKPGSLPGTLRPTRRPGVSAGREGASRSWVGPFAISVAVAVAGQISSPMDQQRLLAVMVAWAAAGPAQSRTVHRVSLAQRTPAVAAVVASRRDPISAARAVRASSSSITTTPARPPTSPSAPAAPERSFWAQLET
jgi:hypothetical protein